VGCILVSFGILLAESGGSWDITNHLFFSPPHVILYSGIGLSLVGATIMFLYWRSSSIYISTRKKEKNLELDFSIKLVISGVSMLILVGPLDFSWHSAFGLDGLLSPPHLTLTIGMLAGSIGALIGITSSYFVILNNCINQEKRQDNNIGKFKNNEKIPL
jgi:hypothetical protein